MSKTIHWACRAVLAGVLMVMGASPLPAASKPHTVIHVVTVKWKDSASPEQIQQALDGVEKLADHYPGIKNIWIRSIKVEGQASGVTSAFVMEFASEQALRRYSGSKAQREWYKVYLPVRDYSRTFDITN